MFKVNNKNNNVNDVIFKYLSNKNSNINITSMK